MNIVELHPKKRSLIRISLGRYYYQIKRFIEWYTDEKKYTKKIEKTKLNHIIFTHQTLLLRQLKSVDMQLQYNKIINLKLAVNILRFVKSLLSVIFTVILI